MAPIVPTLVRELARRTRLARRNLRSATPDELLVYAAAYKRARRDGIPFLLSPDDFNVLVTRANGVCEDTGLPFNNDDVGGQRIRPGRMSLDRLKGDGAYSLQNCRLVHAMINISRNTQSIQMFHVQRIIYMAKLMGSTDLIPDRFVSKRSDSLQEMEF